MHACFNSRSDRPCKFGELAGFMTRSAFTQPVRRRRPNLSQPHMYAGLLVGSQQVITRLCAPTTQQSHHLNLLTVMNWQAREFRYRTTAYPMAIFELPKRTTVKTAQQPCGWGSGGNRQVEHQPGAPHEKVAELNLS